MRAEAKLGKGDNAGALADNNTLRTSRNARPEQTPAPLKPIDLEVLFRESGFELYWEGHRRTYQIRFGKYEDSWTEKTDNDVQKRLSLFLKEQWTERPVKQGFEYKTRGIKAVIYIISSRIFFASPLEYGRPESEVGKEASGISDHFS